MSATPLPARAALAALALLLVGACAPRPGARPAPDSAPDAGRRYDGGANAVATLDRAQLATMRATSVEEMLIGRIPGLEVRRGASGDYAFFVRAGGSFRSDDEALVVLDGMYIRPGGLSQALSGVQPDHVARVQVLKDAGATAFYGMQGVHGVVLITTRRR